MSSLPVERHQAAMSLTEPGSVARTSTSAPEGTVRICWAVCTIGIGQDRPRASTTTALVLMAIPALPSDEDDLAVPGLEVERRDAFHPVDERVEVGGLEIEKV